MRSFPSTRRSCARALFTATATLALAALAVPAHAAGATVPPPGWALARITQTAAIPPGQNTFTYAPNSHGEGVNAYVIDSGIDYDNPDLGGRAVPGFDAFGGEGRPCPGNPGAMHGTEVADVLGGTQYGVANQVKLWSVKIADCGNVPDAAFMAGIQWVIDHHEKPAVAVIPRNNMGWGYFGQYADLTLAVNRLADADVFVAVSSGNVASTCIFSFCQRNLNELYAVDNPPANAGRALVVMASDRADHTPDFTGYTQADGGCVTPWTSARAGDIYAPGVAVPTVFGNQCGTSYAAPMAAGVAALYKSTYGDAPSATVKSWIISRATQNAITNNPPQVGTNPLTYTPNRLLNTGGL